MPRRIFMFFAVSVLSPGCVPVTEPVGDIDKAEPKKELIGSWKDEESKPRLWVVDRPEVKGNPKGLMRVRIVEDGRKLEDVKAPEAMWFFVATADKHIYANSLELDSKKDGTNPELIDFSKEGDYAKWTKHKDRGYFVAHLEINGAVVTADPGNYTAFRSLMKKNQFEEGEVLFHTPASWLTKYLKDNGPGKIFTKSKGKWTLTRVRGK